MRWLIIAILLVARSASAIVIMEPALVRACRAGGSWAELSTCIAKHGFHMELVKSVANARLLRIDEPSGNGKRVEMGYALYVLVRGSWHLGGLYETGEDGFTFLELDTVRVRKVTGFRIDVGFIGTASVIVDGETSQPGRLISKRSVYCEGDNWRCEEVIATCDILVGGMAYYTYRGTVTVDDQARVHNVGMRTLAGPCNRPEQQFLGWSVGP